MGDRGRSLTHWLRMIVRGRNDEVGNVILFAQSRGITFQKTRIFNTAVRTSFKYLTNPFLCFHRTERLSLSHSGFGGRPGAVLAGSLRGTLGSSGESCHDKSADCEGTESHEPQPGTW